MARAAWSAPRRFRWSMGRPAKDTRRPFRRAGAGEVCPLCYVAYPPLISRLLGRRGGHRADCRAAAPPLRHMPRLSRHDVHLLLDHWTRRQDGT